jgi:hypothetical protein
MMIYHVFNIYIINDHLGSYIYITLKLGNILLEYDMFTRSIKFKFFGSEIFT